MDKRIVGAIAGAAVVLAAVWLTTRVGEPGAAEQASSASTTVSVTPQSTERASAPNGSPPESAAARPTVSSEGPATQPGVASPPEAGEALPIDVSPGFEYLGKPAAQMKDTDSMWPNWRRHQ